MQRRQIVNLLMLLAAAILFGCNGLSNNQQTTTSANMDETTTKSLLAGIELPANTDANAKSTEVIFYLKNNTGVAQQYLRWNTPLETPLSADVFQVLSDAGQPMPYVGRKVKRGAPTESDFQTIEVGEEIRVTVDISRYYDIAGTGQYSVALSPLLTIKLYPESTSTDINIGRESLLLLSN